ncbi:MAG: DUF5665 domain-containing protein [Alicyclobacillus sp.]|nr:DUF5665 domain-containing protein [Alicyclobacillus sp.]
MSDVRQHAHDFFVADAERLAAYLERANFAAYADLLQRPLRLIWLNWLGGVFRGLGIGIGFTLIAGLAVLTLEWLEVLNLPVFGRYIAELVRIVQAELHTPTY